MNSTNLIKAIGDINKKIKSNLNKSNFGNTNSISISKHYSNKEKDTKFKEKDNSIHDKEKYNTINVTNEDDENLFTFHNLKLH